ncbi:MAG: 2-C-methyl-D-erythritol 4-phosphate cytidylyltransferase [Candidatus Stahlbacteria bacterium]|nr:2-C-methyl-D-erythritol 4-phosphate cytidylyltransferase [Candidatus Stahlbacteria bacterium]
MNPITAYRLPLTAIILAAGKGERLGDKLPKPYIKLVDIPIIVWATKVFNEHPLIDNIIIITLKEFVNYCRDEIVHKYNLNKVVCVLAGGEKRQDSARIGVFYATQNVGPHMNPITANRLVPTHLSRRRMCRENGSGTPITDTIIIHDAARPLVSSNLITQLIETARGSRVFKGGSRQIPSGFLTEGVSPLPLKAVIPVIPVSNTIKRVEGAFQPNADEPLAHIPRKVVQTLNRENLVETQTPQLFQANILRLAHLKAYQDGVSATDDASLVENFGEKVYTIPGQLNNIKITTSTDLLFAELLIKQTEHR